MWMANFTGLMARRLLVNWRIDPAVAERVLPRKVRPSIVGGFAVAGLCLVRLEQLRPSGFPAWMGMSSENLAIRMGIEWDGPHGTKKAVMIFRRETGSILNGALAERVGYGVHERTHFDVDETANQTNIRIHRTKGHETASVALRDAEQTPQDSAFESLPAAEKYFRGGECGYSPGRKPGTWVGARLHLHRWDLRPMAINEAYSIFMDELFEGTAKVDSAFVMRNIQHTWFPCGNEDFGETRRALTHRYAA